MFLSLPQEEGQKTKLLTDARNILLELFSKNTCKEIAYPLPLSVDTAVKDFTDESAMKLEFTESFHPDSQVVLPLLKRTTVLTVTMDNYDKLFASEDPNEPFAGARGAIIPGVRSWDELISELTVPVPTVWLDPFLGIGEPMAAGGVTTDKFRIREEAL